MFLASLVSVNVISIPVPNTGRIDTTPHLDNRVDEILCWLLENTTFPFKADIKIEEHEIQKGMSVGESF